MTRYLHLSRGESGLFGASIVTIVFVAFSAINPKFLGPLDPSVLIAMAAALLTVFTYLYNRHVLRRRLRVSMSNELLHAVSQLKTFCDNVYIHGATEIGYTAYPDAVLTNQIGELGHLSKGEVERLSEYYSRLQMFKELVVRLDESEVSPDKYQSYLDTTNSNKPAPVELLKCAIDCIDELDIDRTPDIKFEKYPGYSEEAQNTTKKAVNS